MYQGDFKTNCNEEAVIKIIGRVTQEFGEFQDLQKQIELRKLLDEVLYRYEVVTKETSLVASDVEERMKLFFASKRLEGNSNKTEKNYRYILTKFAMHVKKPISSITSMDMRMYLAYAGQNIKPGSVNAMIYCFKSFFSWLVDNEYIFKNPMSKIKATKIPKRIRKPLTDEETELLRQACETLREKTIIELLVSSGIRLDEVYKLNKSDLDFHERSFHVIGKGNKERKVYFSVKAKILLLKYIEERKDECEALIVTVKEPYRRLGHRAIQTAIKKIAARVEFDRSVHTHLFRHTFATHNINSGMPLPVLQHLMGHEDSSTTMIYAELSEENIKHEYRTRS